VVSTAYAELPAATRSSRDVLRGQLMLAAVIIYPLVISPLLTGGGGDELDPEMNTEAAGSNTLNQAFWSILFVLAAVAGRHAPVLRLMSRLWPLTAYLVWSAASVLWAIAPDIAFRRLLLQVFVVGSVLLPIVLIDDLDKVRATVLRVMFAVLVINVAALAIKPPTALGHAGIYSQKNELGLTAALALLTCVTTLALGGFLQRAMAWLGIPLALALLVAAKSKTSLLLAVAIPAMGWGIAIAARVLKLSPALLLGCLLAIAIPFGLGIAEVIDLTLRDMLQLMFGDATFTGRTDIWDFAWAQISANPALGYGFNGFWGVGDASPATFSGNELIASILQAHNGYLDILLETGLVGLGLFLALLAVVALGAGAIIPRSVAAASFVIALTLFTALHNGFESTALRRFHPVWLFMLIAAAMAATADRPAAGTDAEQEEGRC
jgi:O-antigen ligase